MGTQKQVRTTNEWAASALAAQSLALDVAVDALLTFYGNPHVYRRDWRGGL